MVVPTLSSSLLSSPSSECFVFVGGAPPVLLLWHASVCPSWARSWPRRDVAGESLVVEAFPSPARRQMAELLVWTRDDMGGLLLYLGWLGGLGGGSWGAASEVAAAETARLCSGGRFDGFGWWREEIWEETGCFVGNGTPTVADLGR